MAEQISYRHTRAGDLCAIGEIFVAAFPESVRHYVGHAIPPDALADVFAICLDAEVEAFFVAEVDGRVAGYIFAPAHFSRLPGTAVWHGHLWRLAWRWLMGYYGFGLHPVFVAARNWLSLLHEAKDPALFSDARILSIAVHPDFQGRGLGNALMRQGIRYLLAEAVPRIRLEVRPDNGPAVHIYEKLGFTTSGRTRDTQGDWLIMLKAMARNPQA